MEAFRYLLLRTLTSLSLVKTNYFELPTDKEHKHSLQFTLSTSPFAKEVIVMYHLFLFGLRYFKLY